MIAVFEQIQYRTALVGIAIQRSVQIVGFEALCNFLRAGQIVDKQKVVVSGGEGDARLA